MTEKRPLRNLTPGLCHKLRADMLAACAKIASAHGLVVEDAGQRNVDLRWGFEASFRVSLPLADGSTRNPDQLLFELLAPEFGLEPEDYGREFTTGRDWFKLTGIDPRRPKYPISADRIADGKGFKFTAENVAILLRASLKNVSPGQ